MSEHSVNISLEGRPELPGVDAQDAPPVPQFSAGLIAFVCESNRIEGISRAPTEAELEATWRALFAEPLTLASLCAAQAVYAPGMPLRSRMGMDVRVGRYIAPLGGRDIEPELQAIIQCAHARSNPWEVHVRFEKLHPFLDGNGRTGRLLWAWMMDDQDLGPFAIPFLHRFYYQTLENSK